jgi:hypothetical protein
MTVSLSPSALARQWPVVALCFGSALGAMYCAAIWALAHSLVGSHADALGQWRPVAMRYLAGLLACLALFLGSCVWLRRQRTRDDASVRAPAI